MGRKWFKRRFWDLVKLGGKVYYKLRISLSMEIPYKRVIIHKIERNQI